LQTGSWWVMNPKKKKKKGKKERKGKEAARF
jgi:hypothetical protein